MNPERHWAELKRLFHGCLDQPEESREEWLRQQTTDPELLVEALRLLEQHKNASDTFLNESPPGVLELRNPDLFQANELVATRYQITRLLGRGGMGEVYEALDRELNEPVALKVLPLSRGQAETLAWRFRRELQLARRISHPNVCRMFDLQRHQAGRAEFLLLTMELVRGETLSAWIRRRREHPANFDEAETESLVLQILAGLEAVHGTGIVHRDLKPSNIMIERLESGSRAVLMDFGIAYSHWTAAGGEPQTETGSLLGTPEYMAPEILQGGEVTRAADYYSLGLVLFEMASGRRPLEGTTPFATALRRAKEDIVPEVRILETPWQAAIEQCLQRDPAQRPASVEAIRMLLRNGATESPLWNPVTRRRVLIGGAWTVLLSLSAALFRYRNRDPSPASSSIVLTPLANGTGNAEFNNMARPFRDLLMQSPYLKVQSDEALAGVLERMGRNSTEVTKPDVAREAALRMGARFVVFGKLEGSTLAIQLEQAGSRPDAPLRRWEKSFPVAGSPSLFMALEEASVWLRRSMGEAERDIRENNRTSTDLTTGDWDALNRYMQAHDRRQHGDFEAAEVLYREAIGIDPKFVSARRDLADMLLAQYRYREGFAEYQQAMDAAQERRLTNWERYRLEAMYWDDAWDWEKAAERYRTWAVHYPNDFIPVYYFGAKLAGLGRTEEAIARFEQVVRMSDYLGAHEALGVLAMAGERWDAARDRVRQLRRLGQQDRAAFLECRIGVAQSDPNAAHAACAELSRSTLPDWSRRARFLEGLLHAEEGNWGRAGESFLTFVRLATAAGDRPQIARGHLALAFVNRLRGERQAALQSTAEAVRAEPGPPVMGRAAHLYSLLGEAGAIRRLDAASRDWPKLPVFEAARCAVQGELLLATGDGAALDPFRRMDALTPRIFPRDFLAQALDRAGRREEAATIYRDLASHRAICWREPEEQWPGIVRYAGEREKQLTSRS